MTVGELLGNPSAQTPLLVVLAGGLLAIARVIGKRAAASMQRQGTRIGELEILLKAEVTRRRQVEECLREDGIRLPYWPDDPPVAALYRPPAPPRYVDDVDEPSEPATTETYRPPVPTRHRH